MNDLFPKVQALLMSGVFMLGCWVVHTTSDHSDQLTHLTDSVDELKNEGIVRNSEQIKHNVDVDETLDRIEQKQTHQGEDISALKTFVQDLREQKQVIVVHHAEAPIPSIPRMAQSFVNELLGVAPKHYRPGSGRRPGQPKRTR